MLRGVRSLRFGIEVHNPQGIPRGILVAGGTQSIAARPVAWPRSLHGSCSAGDAPTRKASRRAGRSYMTGNSFESAPREPANARGPPPSVATVRLQVEEYCAVSDSNVLILCPPLKCSVFLSRCRGIAIGWRGRWRPVAGS